MRGWEACVMIGRERSGVERKRGGEGEREQRCNAKKRRTQRQEEEGRTRQTAREFVVIYPSSRRTSHSSISCNDIQEQLLPNLEKYATILNKHKNPFRC